MAPRQSNYEVPQKEGTEASVTLLEKPSDASGKTETKTKEDIKLVGPIEIFRYANRGDRLLLILGIFFNVMAAVPSPFMGVMWAESSDYFVEFGKLNFYLDDIKDYLDANNMDKIDFLKDPASLDAARCANISNFYGGNDTCSLYVDERIVDRVGEFSIYLTLLGCNALLCGYLGVTLCVMASVRITNRIRRKCLYSVLHQNVGWFDTNKASEINNRLSEDIVQIQDGLGEKFGHLNLWSAAAISHIIVALIYGWKFTLVLIALCPIIMVLAYLLNKVGAVLTAKELTVYAKAGGIAEEVFGAIKTVVAFGGQDQEADRYYQELEAARRFGVKKAMFKGITLGIYQLQMYGLFGFGYWYGGKLQRDEPENYTLGTTIIVLFSLISSTFHMGNIGGVLQQFTVARGAAYEVFRLIELKSPIDSSLDDGKKPADIKGVIEFNNVYFAYPARPGVNVLDDVSLEVLPGQTVAIVGASGCGKSTTVQLLLRFYDPDKGQVLLDGTDIKDLNIKWLRKNIGLVSQEPVLFSTTIAENIGFGSDDEVTMDEIIAASKNANAYDFIMQLPDKFETVVGEKGALLSGGQKQRIAIARALVGDPKILLLDEATSSLDTESESIIQEALEKASEGRTTLIIAHRLSTIKNADMIIGYKDGQVVEKGTHETLMELKGIYYQLATNQMTSEDNGFEDIDTGADRNTALDKGLTQNVAVSNVGVKKEDDDDDKDLPNAPFLRLLKINSPEWPYIVLGCIGSIIAGCANPVGSYMFSGMMFIFAKDEETQKREFAEHAWILLGIGVISIVLYTFQGIMFGKSGEALTVRLRNLTFKAMLKQDISWYDQSRNGVGALTTRLSTDASQVQGVTGIRAGSVLISVTCMVFCLAIAFLYSWKMSLLLLAFTPLLALDQSIRMKAFARQAEKSKIVFEEAGQITVESVGNIRTVASLSKEDTFFSRYMEKLEEPHKTAMRSSHISGIAFSLSHSTLYFYLATAMIFGAYMIEAGDMTTEDVFRVFAALAFSSMGLGNAAAFAPDLGKAQTSAKRIIHILDSEPSIDHTSSRGKKLQNDYSADLSFNDVNFHYVSRQTVPVLQDLNLSVTPGQTLALVGSSGCGKSTTVQLIERFYDTVSGNVSLDDHDIKTLNVTWLRSQMALVSQEPVLFDRTIAENIAYGDNSKNVSMDEIVQAARTANIHSFITSLPDGYNTNVGAKGTQLSGGQKQRIAIARALVRNPRILLLDEATSSLDTKSESIVQDALDKAREGRTCVVIAHRLSTVQNADKICVIQQGSVTEQGTHNELMAMNGFYKKLVETAMRNE